MPSWIDTKVRVTGSSQNLGDIHERCFKDRIGGITEQVWLSNFVPIGTKCGEPKKINSLSDANWTLVQTVGAISDVKALDFKFSNTEADRYEITFRTCTVAGPPITGLRAMAHALCELTSKISIELKYEDDFDDRWSGALTITSNEQSPEFKIIGHETRFRLLRNEDGSGYDCETEYYETFDGRWSNTQGFQSEIDWLR